MQETIQAKFEDRWHCQRFMALKEDSMNRIGADEMTHAAFLKMLLDVWEHHMEANPGEFQPEITVEAKGDSPNKNIVRDTGVVADEQNA